jgi:16S rRNA (cytosine1402-N4)-methyltransferase
MTYHKPVLLEESVNGLNIKPGGIYVDLTFGGGGHTLGILGKLGKKGKLLAFDQDRDASQNIIKDSRFTFINANFRYLRNFLRYYKVKKIDGALADLGISSHQIDIPERGFSFMRDAALDMRMNVGCTLSAANVINGYDEKELLSLFREYGELPNSKAIVNRILVLRETKKIERTLELVEGVSSLLPRPNRNKVLAQIFQALRMEVNGELDALKDVLKQLPGLLNVGGRIVFLTYHSIEDRIVKNFFKTGNIDGKLNKDFFGNISFPFKLINKNGLVASESEINENPRARSARLRIAEKLDYARKEEE